MIKSPDYQIDRACLKGVHVSAMSGSGNSMHDPHKQGKQTRLARKQKTAISLGRIAEVHKMLLWERAKEHGLTPIQVQILLFVAYHPPEQAKVTFLAEEFFISKASVSDTIKALLSKGLLEKRSQSEDKRSYSLRLSGPGRRLCRKLDSVGEDFLPAISELDESAQENLFQSLLHVLYSLSRSGVIKHQRICLSCTHFDSGAKVARCTLLNRDLSVAGLRVDCPEHRSA